MRAVIMLVTADLKGRFGRCLPPEHRIRAERPRPEERLVELMVEGPMLPEVVDGVYARGDIQLTMHTDEEAGILQLEACWRFWEPPDQVGMSEPWEVGHWSSVAAMMDCMR
jgi:hypothetical protein